MQPRNATKILTSKEVKSVLFSDSGNGRLDPTGSTQTMSQLGLSLSLFNSSHGSPPPSPSAKNKHINFSIAISPHSSICSQFLLLQSNWTMNEQQETYYYRQLFSSVIKFLHCKLINHSIWIRLNIVLVHVGHS